MSKFQIGEFWKFAEEIWMVGAGFSKRVKTDFIKNERWCGLRGKLTWMEKEETEKEEVNRTDLGNFSNDNYIFDLIEIEINLFWK